MDWLPLLFFLMIWLDLLIMLNIVNKISARVLVGISGVHEELFSCLFF